MLEPKALRVHVVSRLTVHHGVHGGMERYLDFLVRGLAERGHRMLVVCSALEHLESIKGNPELVSLPGAFDSGAAGWRRSLQSHFRSGTPAGDVILSNSFAAAPLSGSVSPLVAVIHGTGLVDLISSARLLMYRRRSARAFIAQCLRLLRGSFFSERKFLKSCTRIIAVSSETGQSLVRLYGVSSDKIDVAGGPVDTQTFRPNPEAGFRNPSAEFPIRILTSGTLSPQKGHIVLLEALARLTGEEPSCYTVTIAGKGPEEQFLRRMTAELNLESHVTFAGQLSESELAALHRRHDLFVLATFREEGFPLVISEAMASGLPVIATRVGGNPTAVRENHDGILIEPGSDPSLHSSIRSLAHDPGMRRRLAGNARRRALEELDYRVLAGRVEAALRLAAAEGGKA